MALLQDSENATRSPGAVAAPFGAGSLAGLVAAIPMLAVLVFAGAVAEEPTAKAGVETDGFTFANSVTSFVFNTGLEQFQSGYRFASYPGVALHLIFGLLLGAAGLALIAAVFRGLPNTPAAVGGGLAYGVVLQVVLLFGIVNGLQDVNTVETSVPLWGWWAGHLIFGAVLGIVGSKVLRGTVDSPTDG